jgi:hypothetical protein
MIFQNGGKLKNIECWYLSRQKVEEVNEIPYLRVKKKRENGKSQRKCKSKSYTNTEIK